MPAPMITSPRAMITTSIVSHLGMRLSLRCGMCVSFVLLILSVGARKWDVNWFTCNPIVTGFGLFVMWVSANKNTDTDCQRVTWHSLSVFRGTHSLQTPLDSPQINSRQRVCDERAEDGPDHYASH